MNPGKLFVMTVSFEDFAQLVRARRTSMLIDRSREVPLRMVYDLCEAAQWAPNHKRSWPWRFAVFTEQGRARLGEAFVADMIEHEFGDEGKRQKTLTKYLRTPTVLVVGCAPGDKPSMSDENRDAVAAGIQNMLLGATAMGLASYWGTAPLIDSPRVLELCGFQPDVQLIAVTYLGWAQGDPEPPQRPPVTLTIVAN